MFLCFDSVVFFCCFLWHRLSHLININTYRFWVKYLANEPTSSIDSLQFFCIFKIFSVCLVIFFFLLLLLRINYSNTVKFVCWLTLNRRTIHTRTHTHIHIRARKNVFVVRFAFHTIRAHLHWIFNNSSLYYSFFLFLLWNWRIQIRFCFILLYFFSLLLEIKAIYGSFFFFFAASSFSSIQNHLKMVFGSYLRYGQFHSNMNVCCIKCIKSN